MLPYIFLCNHGKFYVFCCVPAGGGWFFTQLVVKAYSAPAWRGFWCLGGLAGCFLNYLVS